MVVDIGRTRGIHRMNTSCVLSFVPDLLLKLRKIPLGELLIHHRTHLREDVGNLLVETSRAVLVLLNVITYLIRKDLSEHGDKMIDRQTITVLVFVNCIQVLRCGCKSDRFSHLGKSMKYPRSNTASSAESPQFS